MTEEQRILILGLGNILMQDEGLGVKILHELSETYIWPGNVTLMDGGVMGLDLLPYLEQSRAVLIIDAVQNGQPPGTLVRLSKKEIPASIKLKHSVHQISFLETLAMAQFRGTLPHHIVIWGIVPDSIALGMNFSAVMTTQLPTLRQAILDELERWEIVPRRKSQSKTINSASNSTRLLDSY